MAYRYKQRSTSALPGRRVTYAAKRKTKSSKYRVLKQVTGGFQRLKDFEIRINTPIAINCATAQHPTIGELTFANQSVDSQTLDDTNIPPCAPGVAAGASSFSQGAVMCFEPVQWLGKVAGTSQNTALNNSVAFLKGQRGFYGSLKFKLMFAHVNQQAIALLASNAAVTREQLANAQLASGGLPIMVRMCVVRMKGRDVDQLGNVYQDFSLLKPFPEASSKYSKLFDRTYTLGPDNTASCEMTLKIDQWLGRRPGAVTQTAAQAVPQYNRDDQSHMGGYANAVGNNNIHPWRFRTAAQVALQQAAAEVTDSYNPDTSRIVVLFLTSDGTIGGYGLNTQGQAMAGNFAAPTDLDAGGKPSAPHCSISGYIEALAYDDVRP
eukprot:SAG11_NODE_3216_length_2604_cov_3.862275_2_plen_379_part_00